MNSRYQFGLIAVFLHWILFLMIAGLVGSGKYSDSLGKLEKIPELIATHKQVGVAVLMLMSFRLLWRLINPRVPALSESNLIRLLALFTHWLLYVLIIVQALGGVIMSQLLSDHAVTFLGWQLPLLVGDNGVFGAVAFILENKNELRGWHELGAHAIIAVVAVHVAAALAHHFYFVDDTLRRMWFTYKPGFTKDSKVRPH